ncbi:MAG: type II toxin-antitoxin system RelE/ParE family toxin [Candidatus Marinimicrobia bacterium]|nr:type II toxin-antitoxin system RelE/ParE family toxin [Candidatus Neomarinimicrobiota bacterium]
MIQVLQTPLFKRRKKKLYKWQITILDGEINKIVMNPTIGQMKKGDLTGVYVHKFKMKKDLFLLAYTFDPATRTLIMLGSHENFYRDLKKYK